LILDASTETRVPLPFANIVRDKMLAALAHRAILGQFRDLGVRVVAADSGTGLTAADKDLTPLLIRRVLVA
jgi:hypothetical protein